MMSIRGIVHWSHILTGENGISEVMVLTCQLSSGLTWVPMPDQE